MTKTTEFYYPSSNGTSRIHALEWSCEGREPIGVLQISHGVAEYAMRYADFASFLNEQGFVVVANDHIGHGLSCGEGETPVYFGKKDGWMSVVDDMHTLRTMTAEKYPALPYFLLGHSMGSFLARTYLIRHSGAVDGAIIMGTGQNPPAMLLGGKAVSSLIGAFKGCAAVSPLVENLAFGAYNKAFAPNRTTHDWLSVNTDNVDRYLADPMCGQPTTVGLFHDMLGGLQFIADTENLSKMKKRTPVLFISGACDPVGDMGQGVRRAYDSFLSAGMEDVSIVLYDGLRHEILNEDEHAKVYRDIWQWMAERMPKK